MLSVEQSIRSFFMLVIVALTCALALTASLYSARGDTIDQLTEDNAELSLKLEKERAYSTLWRNRASQCRTLQEMNKKSIGT